MPLPLIDSINPYTPPLSLSLFLIMYTLHMSLFEFHAILHNPHVSDIVFSLFRIPS